MSRLRHPNVASVYDFEPVAGGDDHLYTMELVEGCSILDATARSAPDEVVALAVQVYRGALSHVHRCGIIHRDLKPHERLSCATTAPVEGARLRRRRARRPLRHADAGQDRRHARVHGARAGARRDGRSPRGPVRPRRHVVRAAVPPPAVPVVPSLPLLALLARGPIQFDASEAARIPAWLRAVVERLCALDPSRRYRSGSAVIEAINAGGGHAFAIDTVETRESYFFSGRFVGREREQDPLTAFALRRLGVERDASADAPDGAPAVAVSGPSGIGESRLMRELRREIELARFAVVEANCYEDSLAEYGPVADAIAHVVRLADAGGRGGFRRALRAGPGATVAGHRPRAVRGAGPTGGGRPRRPRRPDRPRVCVPRRCGGARALRAVRERPAAGVLGNDRRTELPRARDRHSRAQRGARAPRRRAHLWRRRDGGTPGRARRRGDGGARRAGVGATRATRRSGHLPVDIADPTS